MDKESTHRKIAELKNASFGSTLLRGEHGGTTFSLVLLTADKASDLELMRLLSDWRSAHEQWFQAIFKITVEGTARWYRNQLIETPDRLLFLVESAGRYLGHAGLFRFDFGDDSCEIDNIVRGAAGRPGIMEAAIEVMMAWGERELGIRGYRLQTFADNARALKLYERLGFREISRKPLVSKQSGERIEWVEGEAAPGAAVRFNVSMRRVVQDG